MFYNWIAGESTIFNDEQNKYYQILINYDEQTGSITWYYIVGEEEFLEWQ